MNYDCPDATKGRQTKHPLYDCVCIGLCLVALFQKPGENKNLWIIKFEDKTKGLVWIMVVYMS